MDIPENRKLLILLGVLLVFAVSAFGYLFGQLQKNPYQTDTAAAATPPPYIEEIPHLVDNCNFEFWTCEGDLPHSMKSNIIQLYPNSMSRYNLPLDDSPQAASIIRDARKQEVLDENADLNKISYLQGVGILANHYNINPHVLYPIIHLHSGLISQEFQGPEKLSETTARIFPQYESGVFDRTLSAIRDLSIYYRTYSDGKPVNLETPLGALSVTDQSAATLAVTRLMAETFTDPRLLSHALSNGINSELTQPAYTHIYQRFSDKDPRQP